MPFHSGLVCKRPPSGTSLSSAFTYLFQKYSNKHYFFLDFYCTCTSLYFIFPRIARLNKLKRGNVAVQYVVTMSQTKAIQLIFIEKVESLTPLRKRWG